MTSGKIVGEREGLVDAYCDHCIKVPSAATPRIQEMHVAVGHVLCEIVEEALG